LGKHDKNDGIVRLFPGEGASSGWLRFPPEHLSVKQALLERPQAVDHQDAL
jgi:hypothetical protein